MFKDGTIRSHSQAEERGRVTCWHLQFLGQSQDTPQARHIHWRQVSDCLSGCTLWGSLALIEGVSYVSILSSFSVITGSCHLGSQPLPSNAFLSFQECALWDLPPTDAKNIFLSPSTDFCAKLVLTKQVLFFLAVFIYWWGLTSVGFFQIPILPCYSSGVSCTNFAGFSCFAYKWRILDFMVFHHLWISLYS